MGHHRVHMTLFVTISSKRNVAVQVLDFNQMDAGRAAQICGQFC